MLQKKICVVGSFAVGKTSLVSRYVRSIFSEKYLTTVGVKIDQKVVETPAGEVKLVLWDLHGEDDLQKLKRFYLKGAAGCLLVADGTRPETLEKAVELREFVWGVAPGIPCMLLVNKSDLEAEWCVETSRLEALASGGWDIRRTSAKDDTNVEGAFLDLALRMLGDGNGGTAGTDS